MYRGGLSLTAGSILLGSTSVKSGAASEAKTQIKTKTSPSVARGIATKEKEAHGYAALYGTAKGAALMST